MEKGFFYVDDGNDFWKLIDHSFFKDELVFERLRRAYKNANESKRKEIKEEFINKLNSIEVGLSDVISKCENTTRSKDETIIEESIEYNHELKDLIDFCDVIILNGVGDTKRNFKKAIREKDISINNKKMFYLNSSANYQGLTSEKKDKRRERIYIVGFLDREAYKNFEFPEPVALTNTLDKCIDFDVPQDSKFYYTNENCSFYSTLVNDMAKEHTVYQWRRVYVRENKSNVCPTLTANMGTGGHNVPLVRTSDGRIRKLTPRECFNLQGFPKEYILPTNVSNTLLYKQAGNSVVVSVIKAIAKEIYKAFNIGDDKNVANSK